jgi:hypothetical protein
MKRFILAICAMGIGLAPASAVLAQDDDGANMGRVFIVDVKDGHGDEFREGVKAYFDCYGENGGKRNWNVYSAETGKLGRYAFTFGGHKWAVFDEQEEASKACSEVFEERFLAHINKAQSEFTRHMAEQSNVKDGEYNVAWVINFEVGDGRRFVEAISKINEAAKEAEWGNYVWYDVVAGGRHSGDFFIVILEENFAGFDEDNEPLWKMVEGVHGKKTTEKLRTDLNETITADWSNIWRRLPDLSYSPESE